MIDPGIKKLISVVEHGGDPTGDYAQLEQIALDDLQKVKGKFKGATLDQVKKDPVLYDQVVEAYWNRLDDFGIKNTMDKTIWWLMPGRFKKSQGNPHALKDPVHKNVMLNRVKNLGTFLQGPQPSQYTGILGGR